MAVDLETACLFALGETLDSEVAALHIVSDHPQKKKIDKDVIFEILLDGVRRTAEWPTGNSPLPGRRLEIASPRRATRNRPSQEGD